MIPDKKLNDFVSRLRDAAGANLESVVLFGSAVTGEFHPEFSNLNVFCVIRDSSFCCAAIAGTSGEMVGRSEAASTTVHDPRRDWPLYRCIYD